MGNKIYDFLIKPLFFAALPCFGFGLMLGFNTDTSSLSATRALLNFAGICIAYVIAWRSASYFNQKLSSGKKLSAKDAIFAIPSAATALSIIGVVTMFLAVELVVPDCRKMDSGYAIAILVIAFIMAFLIAVTRYRKSQQETDKPKIPEPVEPTIKHVAIDLVFVFVKALVVGICTSTVLIFSSTMTQALTPLHIGIIGIAIPVFAARHYHRRNQETYRLNGTQATIFASLYSVIFALATLVTTNQILQNRQGELHIENFVSAITDGRAILSLCFIVVVVAVYVTLFFQHIRPQFLPKRDKQKY